MRRDYYRYSTSLYSARGYGRFSEKWDIEVARRFMRRMEQADANDNTVLVRRKTPKQLQDHYDDFIAKIRRTHLVSANDPAMNELDATLRNNRRNRQPTQQAEIVQGIQYNQMFGGQTPFGTPTALNTNIAASGMVNAPRASQQMAPFALRTVNPNQIARPTTMNPVGPNYRRNKYCVKCGYSKRLHGQLKHVFGFGCDSNCGHEQCSKCGERVELHNNPQRVGPYCHKAAFAGSSFYDWYKEPVEN
ncbi:hypothetical protein SEMRO_976_G226900.1 [Seminavis robusta]|uniref:Uncharacterized protein n=1 Tax=Seminavis robusta TaxID=568900 RepID=A0A9N8HNC6_9STRA|nr:hypothetical protein SEMRO_976_G226900.1 [Seminavis robusta]|eukprot:Sro976_g226900.1 n/a (247) ;mRNA; f:2360-3100